MRLSHSFRRRYCYEILLKGNCKHSHRISLQFRLLLVTHAHRKIRIILSFVLFCFVFLEKTSCYKLKITGKKVLRIIWLVLKPRIFNLVPTKIIQECLVSTIFDNSWRHTKFFFLKTLWHSFLSNNSVTSWLFHHLNQMSIAGCQSMNRLELFNTINN